MFQQKQPKKFRYLTLPSNVKSFDYNTVAEYRTILHEKVDLPNDEVWKVGLSAISYTKSWYNVKEPVGIKYFNAVGDEVELSKYLQVPIGHYTNIEELVIRINYILKELDEIAPELKYDKYTHKVTILPGQKNRGPLTINDVIYPELGSEIEYLLGLRDNEVTFKDYFCNNLVRIDTYVSGAPYFACTGHTCADITAGYHLIYIYCDIVEHNLIGDASAQLVGIVDVPKGYSFGEQITIPIHNPLFLPLQTQSFKEVTISFKDDTGKRIPFEFGRSLVQLKLIEDE